MRSEHYTELKTLLSWSAPGRPFKKKSKEFFISSILIVFLIELILFLFSEYLLMLVVLTLFFLAVSLAITPPKNFHYKISSQGIKVEDHFYIWEELYDFYFKRIDGVDVLVVRTTFMLPGELKISLGQMSREHVKRVLAQYLPYREVMKQTFMEKSSDWLSHTFPLEK